MAPYVVDAARLFVAMAPHELKEGFRKTYAQVKAAWENALRKGHSERARRGKGKSMKDKFDALVEQLLKGNIFLPEAIEILEKSMIRRALERRRRQPVRRQQATGHPPQHAAAEDGGVRLGERPRPRAQRKPMPPAKGGPAGRRRGVA